MVKSVYIKMSAFVLLLFVVISFIYVKYDVRKLVGNKTPKPDTGKPLKSLIDDTDSIPPSPVYFSVFKFVNNFNPSK